MNETNVTLTADSLRYLRATKPWVRLISIVLWVASAFTILGALIFIFGGPGVMQGMESAEGMGAVLGVFYAALALVYVFLALYLGRFAGGIGDLVSDPGAAKLEYALRAQKSFWTLSGVLTLVSLVIVGLGIIAAIVVPIIVGGAG